MQAGVCPEVLNAFSLIWGVRAFYYNSHESTDGTITEVHAFLKEKGFVQKGDVIINTASIPIQERQLTNMIKVSVIK